MTNKILVLTTAGSPEEASRIANHLVAERLAACVTVLPAAQSVYRWQGAVETSTEVQMLIKSRRDLFPVLSKAVQAIHSYELPELIALPIVDGSAGYLEWLDSEMLPGEMG